MNWLEEVNTQEESFNKILSFDEYMTVFESNPHREVRNTSRYLKDMFEFYGQDERGAFNLFKKTHPHASAVNGQIDTQKSVYKNLSNFVEEGFNNKFLLLVGPNGSSKSTFIKKIMLAAEDYSKSDEGALYSFSWIFPIDTYVKGSLGLSSSSMRQDLTSYAYLEDKDIATILSSELRDHPLLLIPLKTRQKLIEDAFENEPALLDDLKKSYLYHGDISKKNKLIYDALLKNYQGDYSEVLKHIRVERFVINKLHSVGAATIEPQIHSDARLQQITMDKRLANLPPSLQSLNLFTMSGEIVLANRGILEFSDLLKRPLDAFKYLLMTMETSTINLQGILTELDIFFIGSSNEIHLEAFKQHPDYKSFKGRFNFIKVPYLTNYLDEKGIYSEQIENLKAHVSFEPNAIETLSLWAVMTRIRASQHKNFKDQTLGKIAERLNPLEKALLYSEEVIPEKFNSEETQLLSLNIDSILHEYTQDPTYEGRFGISPRSLKQIIYDIAQEFKTITFIDVLDYLKSFVKRKNEFDFLQITPQGDYHNVIKFIEYLKEYNLDILDSQVRSSLGLVDERSYEDYIARYVQNINALIKGEKIKNNVTGKFEESDSYFIKEFEANLDIKEKIEDFRANFLSKIGAYSLDNPGEQIIYTKIFAPTVRRLKESFRKEQAKIINKLSKKLVFYISEYRSEKQGEREKTTVLSDDDRREINKVITALKEQYHYSEQGALNLLNYLISKRYNAK